MKSNNLSNKKYQALWEISPKIVINDSYSLSLVYTPGVGDVSTAIYKNPEKSFELTNRGNSVAIISDNSEINSLAKIPETELLAAKYNKYAGIDAYPFVIETSCPTEIADILINLAPSFSCFVLSGISYEKNSQIKEILKQKNFNMPVIFDLEVKQLTETCKTKICSEKTAALLLRALLDTRCGKITENILNTLKNSIINGNNESEIVYNIAKAVNTEKISQIDNSPEKIKENFSDYLSRGRNLPIENPVFTEEIEKLSLGEKSIELHKITKGAIETSSNIDITNIITDIEKIREEINNNPDAAYELTNKGNLVAVISDGSAVLGLGNIGAEAAMPVMEGKSALFKTLGGINAIPICLKTQDTAELTDIISKISPILGGINLEDISAPRCFEIEKALIEKLNIPVFHDDQHGTAVVVLAGFINALKLTDKDINDVKIVVNGAGAGAIAVSNLLIKYGAKNLILCDRTGAIFDGRQEGMNHYKEQTAKYTNPKKEKGLLRDVIKGADFFIGLSAGNIADKEMIKSMTKKAVVFALANPIPEIMPQEALEAGAFIVATGRSDYKNQVNNSLAFPGIFRGALNVRARKITDDMKISASLAIANMISESELSTDYIIPHALNPKIPSTVAKAVEETALKTNMSEKTL